MSVAYTDGAETVDAVTLKAALAAIEQPLSGTVFVDRPHLVEQWHDGGRIMWNPIAEVPPARTSTARQIHEQRGRRRSGPSRSHYRAASR